jgi:hypothetical protein
VDEFNQLEVQIKTAGFFLKKLEDSSTIFYEEK